MAKKIQTSPATKKVAAKKTLTQATPAAKPAAAVRVRSTAKKVVATKASVPVAKKIVTPVAKQTKKPAARRKPVVAKTTRPVTQHIAAAAPVVAVQKTPTLYPAPHYTRWTLATLGEYYLMAILFSLVILGILYWCAAMSQVWTIF